MKHLSKIAVLIMVVVLSSCGIKRKPQVVRVQKIRSITYLVYSDSSVQVVPQYNFQLFHPDPTIQEPSFRTPTTITLEEMQRAGEIKPADRSFLP
jgi:hypothetical protein